MPCERVKENSQNDDLIEIDLNDGLTEIDLNDALTQIDINSDTDSSTVVSELTLLSINENELQSLSEPVTLNESQLQPIVQVESEQLSHEDSTLQESQSDQSVPVDSIQIVKVEVDEQSTSPNVQMTINDSIRIEMNEPHMSPQSSFEQPTSPNVQMTINDSIIIEMNELHMSPQSSSQPSPSVEPSAFYSTSANNEQTSVSFSESLSIDAGKSKPTNVAAIASILLDLIEPITKQLQHNSTLELSPESSVSEHQPRPVLHRQRTQSLVLLSDPQITNLVRLVYFCFFADALVVTFNTSFLPSVALDMGISESGIGAIYAAAPLAVMLSTPFNAFIISKLGKTFTLYLALLFLSVGTCVFGFASNLSEFLLASLIQGFGVSFLNVSLNSIMLSLVSNLDKAQSKMEMYSGIGFCVGPPIGGLLYAQVGFAWSYIIVSLFPLLALLFVLLSNLKTHPLMQQHHQIASENESNETDDLGWKSLWTPSFLVTTLVTIEVWLLSSSFHPSLGPHVQKSLGLSSVGTGFFLSIPAVAYIIGACIALRVSKRLSLKRSQELGLALATVSLFLLGPLAQFLYASRWMSYMLNILALSLFEIGMAFTFVPVLALMSSSVKVESPLNSNRISVVLCAAISIGEFFGPTVAGALLGSVPQTYEPTCQGDMCTSGFQWTNMILGLTTLVTLGLVITFVKGPKESKEEEKIVLEA